MITLNASADYGMSGQYVARITGRSSKFTFEREFIGRKSGKRNDHTSADVDEAGLYETCDAGRKGKDWTYYVVLPAGDDVQKHEVDKESAMKIARAMDEGRDLGQIVRLDDDGDIEVLTAAAAAKQQAAQTVEAAIEAAWAALQSLPTKQAKQAITELRKRVSPKVEADAGSADAGESSGPDAPANSTDANA